MSVIDRRAQSSADVDFTGVVISCDASSHQGYLRLQFLDLSGQPYGFVSDMQDSAGFFHISIGDLEKAGTAVEEGTCLRIRGHQTRGGHKSVNVQSIDVIPT